MDSGIQMHVYEDTSTYKDGHTYEPIKTVKKDDTGLISWKQRSIIFILILVVSLVYIAIGLTVTYFILHSLIDEKMANMDRRIDELSESNTSIPEIIKKMVRENSERVGFTSCGGSIASESRIKFTSLRSSHGINVSTSYDEGRFSPNKAGFYLVLSNILSNSQDGYFIRKNGNEIARAWTHYSDSHTTPRYTASLAAFVQLSLNDVITIEGKSVDFSSCLTMVQL
ncbi:Hypothetical predicted protein [Mytilus galloprovincialis]|uniref:Uncharacterized protein n=1 Tax=Mytilus galloprovincialis TaxID=29158 RepID=A0A8B6DVT8_MYTGA|nr:Hypothetical predicted protein [Mytilus galloprovincialis]